MDKLNKAKHLPLICIIDVDLPDNGYDVVKAIKQRWTGIKFLVFTDCDTEYAVARMIQNGVNGYILKNSTEAQVKKALNDIHKKGVHYSKIAPKEMFEAVHNNEIRIPRISVKQLIYLELAAQGLTNAKIAENMEQSPRTIDGYRDKFINDFKLKNKNEIITFAIRSGLLNLNELK